MVPALAERKRQVSPEVERQLCTVDPQRVFQTAEAKPGVPQLAIVGLAEQRIAAGGSATLAVQAAPAAVVTFATSDGGEFANHAASITVLADDQGLAQATMTAPRGTLDDVPVHIGSPAAVGTVTMLVHVFYAESPLHTLAAP